MPANRHGRYHNQNHGRKQNEGNIPMKQEQNKKNFLPIRDPGIKLEDVKAEIPLAPEQDGESKSAVPPSEKKFTQRSRLFVGNLPLDMTEQEFRGLFSKYGEISEIFVNSGKGFGFVRLDTRANAEKAKWELDGHQIKNRQLRIRFASHGAALSLKHLSPYVSNEVLENAFSQFGSVERAVVIVDDRGRSTGRGIVEFARKTSATKALQQITAGCFLLTSSPQAVVVKPLEQEDTEDGLSEKNIPRSQQYFQEREAPPRFAQLGTFEYEFALRWKALDEMERDQQEQLTKTIAAAREKLESEMENAIHEHKTRLMKQDLLRRQEDLRRLEEARMMETKRRKQLEFAREEAHQKELENLAKRQEILRAQVEGNYKSSSPRQIDDQGFGPPNMGQQQRPGPGFNNPPPMQLQEAIVQEMMAGGQGGLGPAPSRQARFDQGMGDNPQGGRGFQPQGGPGYGNPGAPYGGGGNQRRNYGNPMEYDGGSKRRRY